MKSQAGDFIAFDSLLVIPKVVCGTLSTRTFAKLTPIKQLVCQRGPVIFSGVQECMTLWSGATKTNMETAMQRLREFPCAPVNLRFDDEDLQKTCTSFLRAAAVHLGFGDEAHKMHAFSARYVAAPAEDYHIDRLGYGPSVLVINVTKVQYPVRLAPIKAEFKM